MSQYWFDGGRARDRLTELTERDFRKKGTVTLREVKEKRKTSARFMMMKYS
jgi:hypothetical protein